VGPLDFDLGEAVTAEDLLGHLRAGEAARDWHLAPPPVRRLDPELRVERQEQRRDDDDHRWIPERPEHPVTSPPLDCSTVTLARNRAPCPARPDALEGSPRRACAGPLGAAPRGFGPSPGRRRPRAPRARRPPRSRGPGAPDPAAPPPARSRAERRLAACAPRARD